MKKVISLLLAALMLLPLLACESAEEKAAKAALETGDYREAAIQYEAAGKIDEAKEYWYKAGEKAVNAGEKGPAAIAFGKAGDYSDARDRSFALWNEVAIRHTIVYGGGHFYFVSALKDDGTVYVAGQIDKQDYRNWKNIVAIEAGGSGLYGLRADGTVVSCIYKNHNQDCSDWTDIVAISVGGNSIVGLKSDGTVVFKGGKYEGSYRDLSDTTNQYGEANVEGWTDIVAVSTNGDTTVGLKMDGTVIAAGQDAALVSGWKNVVAIQAFAYSIAALRADGTVAATGDANTVAWKNVTALGTGTQVSAVDRDGNVLYAYDYSFGYREGELDHLSGIVDLCNHFSDLFSLDKNGRLQSEEDHDYNLDLKYWKNIKMREVFSYQIPRDTTSVPQSVDLPAVNGEVLMDNDECTVTFTGMDAQGNVSLEFLNKTRYPLYLSMSDVSYNGMIFASSGYHYFQFADAQSVSAGIMKSDPTLLKLAGIAEVKEVEFEMRVQVEDKNGDLCTGHATVNQSGVGPSAESYKKPVASGERLLEFDKIDSNTKSKVPIRVYVLGMTYAPLYDSEEAYPAMILFVTNGYGVESYVSLSDLKNKGSSTEIETLGRYCTVDVPAQKDMLLVWTADWYAREKDWSNLNSVSFKVSVHPDGCSFYDKVYNVNLTQLDYLYD